MRAGCRNGIPQRASERYRLDAARDLRRLLSRQCYAIRQTDVGNTVNGSQFSAKPLQTLSGRQVEFASDQRVDMLLVADDSRHGISP